jgi:hypothetical protein
VSRGKAFVPCTNDGVYCGGDSRRFGLIGRRVAADLDLDPLVARNGLALSSLFRVYLSLGVRFGTVLPKWTGLSGEGGERDETKRSGEVNQFLARLALSALTHRRLVLPRTGEQLTETSCFVGELGAKASCVSTAGGDGHCLRSLTRRRFRIGSREGLSGLVFVEALPSEDSSENKDAVEDVGGSDDCIVDAVKVSGIPGV